jgi:hypothetical protein
MTNLQGEKNGKAFMSLPKLKRTNNMATKQKETPKAKSLGEVTQQNVEHTKTLKAIKDSVGMIWLTMVGYIVYLEFFKG